MAEAVILAAGFSSRAKGFKMEMQLGDKAVLQHVIAAFYPVCSRIYVVGGHEADRLIPLIAPYADKTELVYNEGFEAGMFSSVQAGAGRVTEDFFITPGDLPLITAKLCMAMLELGKEYVIPVVSGRKGHPLLLPKRAARELTDAPQSHSLRDYLATREITYYETDEPGIVLDIDTREDYENLVKAMAERMDS